MPVPGPAPLADTAAEPTLIETQKVPVPEAASPLMAQYWAIKAQYPDSLLFYRMGDFYELFFADAAKAATTLDITLTKRGRHEGEDIPMCGVPVHAADAYLARLIRAGHKVAVCEQVEDPAAAKKRGSKSVVRRDVVRLVTPGTLTEDTLLDARANNYLACLARAEQRLALAWLDMSTGDFYVAETDAAALAHDLARIAPGELVVADGLLQNDGVRAAVEECKAALTPLPSARFDALGGERRLKLLYGVAALDAYGAFSRAELAAAGALVDYVELTQKGKLPRFRPLTHQAAGAVMAIDAATRRNLELTSTLTGERGGSLLAAIDRTLTGAGARLLASRLAAPLTDPAAIAARHDMVAYALGEERWREGVRDALRSLPDFARALTRLGVGRGGPRDLAAIRDGLIGATALRDRLEAQRGLPAGLASVSADLGHHGALIEKLGRSLAAELPLLARDGGFIAAGCLAALDEFRVLRDESRRHIAALQARYADSTGVPGLKIRHNNVLGFYIEITPRHADRMGEGFIHRQSMANAMRYSTVELGELEIKISQAGDRALALELQLFDELANDVAIASDAIALAADAVARLDVATASAELAAALRWCRPQIDDSDAFVISAGRHPVVEAALLASSAGPFVANDCDLGAAQRLWLITGPNMAGKSTFLRQNALIAVLAQAGCYVPADAAHIGIVDRLFSRVGAADDLARGRSTFMVEMVETAAILHQSGPRALVILDEIGRGTATFDGLSIAWAVVEHLHEVNRCRALFATHYHELTALAGKLPALANHAMRVKEWQGEVVFLHEVGASAADRSYGIQVAKLAGLPASVIGRAETVLTQLEKSGQSGSIGKLVDDLPLFSSAARIHPAVAAKPSELEAALAKANLDELTPRQALDLLYQLKSLLGER